MGPTPKSRQQHHTTPPIVSSPTMTVYHATPKKNIKPIIETGFRFPTESKGYKLGLGVYFGKDKDYCHQEAINTAVDASGCECGESGLPRSCEKEIAASIGVIEVVVDISHVFDFGDFVKGQHGELKWPLRDIPMTAKGIENDPLYGKKHGNGNCIFPFPLSEHGKVKFILYVGKRSGFDEQGVGQIH